MPEFWFGVDTAEVFAGIHQVGVVDQQVPVVCLYAGSEKFDKL